MVAVLIMGLLLVGVGCSKQEEKDAQTDAPKDTLKVALLINGTLGDKSFFDSADRGLQLAKEKYGDAFEYKTIEMTTDETKWLPTLYDYVDDGSWDIIIGGTWQMKEPFAEVAPKHPDQKFILYDEQMDYSAGDYSNIYSIMYKQNEVSFLAGALAAQMSKTNTIGFLGGSENPIINDFLIGYIQGAKYVKDDIKMVISFVGNFHDTPKGKDLALAQYEQSGVDVGFNVAGLAGLGQIDAAIETDHLSIGVDSDQAAILGEPSASHIPTSALKNVDESLLRAMGLAFEDKVPYGEIETLGLSEKGVGLAKNEHYEKMVPEDVRKMIDELEEKILSGEIKVDTSLGKTTEEINAIKKEVE